MGRRTGAATGAIASLLELTPPLSLSFWGKAPPGVERSARKRRADGDAPARGSQECSAMRSSRPPPDRLLRSFPILSASCCPTPVLLRRP